MARKSDLKWIHKTIRKWFFLFEFDFHPHQMKNAENIFVTKYSHPNISCESERFSQSFSSSNICQAGAVFFLKNHFVILPPKPCHVVKKIRMYCGMLEGQVSSIGGAKTKIWISYDPSLTPKVVLKFIRKIISHHYIDMEKRSFLWPHDF